MSIPKKKLHDLIDEIPDSETDKIIPIIEDLVKKIKMDKLTLLYAQPFKVEGEIDIPPRDDRNER